MADPAPEQAPSSPNASTSGDPVADRRRKLQRLREEFKVDPFGQSMEGLIPLDAARARYDKAADEAAKAPQEKAPQGQAGPGSAPPADRRPIVKIAGRVVLHRDIGKLVFLTIRDATGDLQIGVSKKSVDETSFQIAKLADLGDIVVAQGRLGTTKTGEITVWAESSLEPSPSGRGQGEGTSGLASDANAEHPQYSGVPSPQPSPTGRGGQTAFSIASKSLEPPPEKWHGLTDPELRYRKRYVDLYANPQVMRTMQLRIQIVEEIRQYLRRRGFLEVETPMMQPLAGGAAARPFVTHHNALDIDLFLRIAPELYLKRLLVGGFSKVFEINRNFRNEGISPKHNPEFTMLEAYEAFGSWETMADLVEEMICTVADKVFGTQTIEHKDAEGKVVKTINLKRPWRRVPMVELVAERTGWKFDKRSIHEDGEALHRVMMQAASKLVWDSSNPEREVSQILDASIEDAGDSTIRGEVMSKPLYGFYAHLLLLTPAEQLVEVYEKLIEPTLIDPTFVTHVPSVVIPLARENREDPFFADVYELAINGQEISPGYSELNDPDVQERHFRHQVGEREEQQQVDEDFLNALRVGMPPAGGMGLGIDRLVMMLTGAESIRDVILFPLMRPQV